MAKQGDLTVDEVEEELGMLLERMEFLEKTLQRLKKENAKDLWRVCIKQNNCESVGKPSSPQKDWHLGITLDGTHALERVASCTDKNAYGSESTCRLGMSAPHAPTHPPLSMITLSTHWNEHPDDSSTSSFGRSRSVSEKPRKKRDAPSA